MRKKTACRKQHGNVDTLRIHGLELGVRIPASTIKVEELFESSETFALSDDFVVPLHWTFESGDDLSVVHKMQIDQIVFGALF